MRQPNKAGLAALSLTVIGLAGCGSSPSPQDATPPGAAAQDRPLEEADLAAVHDAAERAGQAQSGRYVLTQSLAGSNGPAEVLLTRTGQYDKGASVHLVDVSAPVSGEDVELSFLTTAGDVLMKNPSFTARHGKPWTRLPATGLATVGVDPAAAVVEPPALDVVSGATVPGRVSPGEAGDTHYDVSVSQYDAIELFASTGYLKMAELVGLPAEELPEAFADRMPATVTVGEDGDLRALSVDLRPLLERAAEVATKSGGPLNSASLQVLLTLEPDAAVDIAVPAESDIGPFE